MGRSSVASVGLLILAASCSGDSAGTVSQQATPAADAAAVRQAIEAGNAGLIAALQKNDSTAAASFYDDSAMAMPPDMPGSVGRANIVKMFGGMAGMFAISDQKLRVRDVIASGEVASETGHYEWTLTPKTKGAKPMKESGKYVVV